MYNYFIETDFGNIFQVVSGGEHSDIVFGSDYGSVARGDLLSEDNLVSKINRGILNMKDPLHNGRKYDYFFTPVKKVGAIYFKETRQFWKEEV